MAWDECYGCRLPRRPLVLRSFYRASLLPPQRCGHGHESYQQLRWSWRALGALAGVCALCLEGGKGVRVLAMLALRSKDAHDARVPPFEIRPASEVPDHGLSKSALLESRISSMNASIGWPRGQPSRCRRANCITKYGGRVSWRAVLGKALWT